MQSHGGKTNRVSALRLARCWLKPRPQTVKACWSEASCSVPDRKEGWIRKKEVIFLSEEELANAQSDGAAAESAFLATRIF